jgi:hypothetical protein
VDAGRPLRVAMLVESPGVPAWLAALASRLAAAPDFDLDVFAQDTTQEGPPRPLLLRLYERLDARIFRWRLDALEPVEIEAGTRPAEGFEDHDVVLDFASSDPVALARGVPCGAWKVTHDPAEWLSDRSLYTTQIHAHFADGRRTLLYTSYGAIDPASPSRTRHQALWKAQGAVAHLLETVRRRGLPFAESRAKRAASASPHAALTRLSNRVVADRAARAALGVAWRLARGAVGNERWFIATRPRRLGTTEGAGPGPSEGFMPVEWSSHSAIADPFVLEDGEATYVFFEDEDPATQRAKISYVRLDPDGRSATAPRTALARPYHLSYPFVFRHEGDVFMIPESSENRTVELYRARPFPSNWTLERVLLEDVRALDATLHAENDRLWLFVSIAEAGAAPNDELHLYSSTTLAGPWQPHPANPVVSDVRSARPAGRIFRHGDDLIRPSQDCSRRYGYALVFNRIDVLTDDDYAETPVGRTEPDWFPGLIATHTYALGTNLEAIDGKRLVPRRPFRRFRERSADSREHAT